MPKRIKTLLKNKQPWQWPSCNHPKTLSFRQTPNNVFNTINSLYLDPSESYRFTNSSSECTTLSDDEEMVIRGVRLSDSQRLFFEETSSSILKEETPINEEINSKVVAVEMAMESENPYMDFKKSMAEMVESHGLIKDWDRLEELLGWYLKMNTSSNHSFIVAAFLDLLLPTNSGISCSDSTSYSSVDSCFS